ncbi:MAG: DUF4290 domain-containing protein [Bacteroidaceae bacterium]|jgi:hypothetical protein|nr:DUF4290 domain-containing protein [Bacteroidaceae bacterium]
MPEYGRSVQQMVEYCKTIADRNERLRCARTIIATMSSMVEHTADKEDFNKKLWNHLAAIAQYDLDIDYPVDIERIDDENARPEQLSYPQKRIQKRNYGSIVEKFAEHLATMEQGAQRDELALLVANHMKRDLSNWSVDSMSDERVADDMAAYTDGKVQIDLDLCPLVSDGELLSSRISTSLKKKKKK